MINVKQVIHTYSQSQYIDPERTHAGVRNFSRNIATRLNEGEELEYMFIDDVKLIHYINNVHKYHFSTLSLSLQYDILLLANLALKQIDDWDFKTELFI